jgi:hypothetical protein
MAKRFAGFTPEQLGKIIPEMSGMQSDEQAKFLAATPSAAARVNMMSEKARAAIEGRIGMAAGGVPSQFISYVDAEGRNSQKLNPEWTAWKNQPKTPAPTVKKPATTPAPAVKKSATTPAPAVKKPPVTPKTGSAPTPITNGYSGGRKVNTTDRFITYTDAEGRVSQKPNPDYGKLYNVGIPNPPKTPSKTPTTMPTEPTQPPTTQPSTGKAPSRWITYENEEGLISQKPNPDYEVWKETGKTPEQIQEEERIAEEEKQQRRANAAKKTFERTQGGTIDLDNAKSNLANEGTRLNNLKSALDNLDPSSENYEKDLARYEEAIKMAEAEYNKAEESYKLAQEQYSLLNKPSKDELLGTAIDDPSALVSEADVKKIEVTEDQFLGDDVGKLSDETPKADVTTADGDYTAETPEAKEAVSVDTATVTAEVQATLDKLEAATGKPSDEALVDAATMSPEDLAQLGLSAAQIEEAIRVQKPTERTLQEGELISGSSVDMDRVTEEIDYTAATGTPSSQATVQGQLTGLMKQFEGGATPPWAAGAMRAAAAQMAARGLSASSMAGQAIVQATMESSINIASVDAATFSRFEERNLSNKQQMAVLAAEQRASFLNLEFTQDFQAKVENASKITEIANANYNTDVQIALENSRNAQSVQLANLNAQNAKILADAAAMTNIDMANLNNRQQAAVTNAKAFLEMDMANLDNEQQTATFKAQGLINAMFNDQAAENASRQFNATSQMQTDQFYDNLSATVSMFNAEQRSTIDRFNAGEINSAEQLYVKMKDAREQFNAQNSLLVEQANTAWLQSVSTADTAAQNLANRDAALAATGLTSMAFEGLLQESRDIMSFAWQTENNDADRAVQLMLGKMKIDEAKSAAKASGRAGFWGAIGKVAASAIFKVPN